MDISQRGASGEFLEAPKGCRRSVRAAGVEVHVGGRAQGPAERRLRGGEPGRVRFRITPPP